MKSIVEKFSSTALITGFVFAHVIIFSQQSRAAQQGSAVTQGEIVGFEIVNTADFDIDCTVSKTNWPTPSCKDHFHKIKKSHSYTYNFNKSCFMRNLEPQNIYDIKIQCKRSDKDEGQVKETYALNSEHGPFQFEYFTETTGYLQQKIDDGSLGK